MEYRSNSQSARIFSESWVTRNGYCLACESDALLPTKANTQARDFECGVCGHAYELKSSGKPFGTRVVDGAYASMIRRVESASIPSFLLMGYSPAWTVTSLTAIHHSLITREVIQRRPALSETARRAGWIGCNLLLGGIPPEGRIPIISDGVPVVKSESRRRFALAENLARETVQTRSWARAVLQCLHRLPSSPFTLAQVYEVCGELSTLYPENRNIGAKIRQQLQVLRDADLLVFEGPGNYRLVTKSSSANLSVPRMSKLAFGIKIRAYDPDA